MYGDKPGADPSTPRFHPKLPVSSSVLTSCLAQARIGTELCLTHAYFGFDREQHEKLGVNLLLFTTSTKALKSKSLLVVLIFFHSMVARSRRS